MFGHREVYVGGLRENTTADQLDNVFHKFGRIHRIWISSYPPIFAFVEFDDTRQAENAIRALDGTYICGSRARVEMARKRWRGGRGFRSSASYRDRSRSYDRERYRTVRKVPEEGRGRGEGGGSRTDDEGVERNVNKEQDRSNDNNERYSRNRLDNVFSPRRLHNADDDEEIGLEGDSYYSPVTPPKEKDRSNDNRKRASDTKTTPQSSKQFISQLFECLVCYDKVKLNNVVFCNIPVSATEDSDPEAHTFCLTCVSGHASAAVGEIPMAKGGIGLRCMATGCDNPILYSEIRMVLSEDVQKKLDERILQESIGMASIDKLERCKNCNFAMQMEVDKKINKVFDCLGCGAKMCRICERNWDDEHFGISCEELDAKYKDKKDKKEREIEKQLNEIIVRKCSRCGIQFIKEKGCNKMTCRCGMTQCYLCREIDIKDTHFCQHFRDPKKKICKQCDKKCLFHENSEKIDEKLIKEIKEKEENK
uniref:Uncharacterized protein n=1 Tax=Meloidogyne enterolobii TaxID=390850 RepID=A0A6V7X491_MELEN|nr:unnamed protein product [Meloidogyne enterolobii]